jgi:hypothetical protein
VFCFLLFVIFLTAISTQMFAEVHTTATPKVRVTTPVDNTKRTTLHGHVPAAVRHGSNLGRVDASTRSERMILLLKSDEDQKRELRRVLDEQQDKKTANFHQWVTPQDFGTRFGVHDSDIAQVSAWLTSQGFTIDEVTKGKRIIRFSGTVGQIENAFQTQMHYFLMPNGETHVSNDRDISIPTALSPVVGGIASLNDFFRKGHLVPGGVVSQSNTPIGKDSRMRPGPRFTSSSSVHYVSAADFATIYNSAPLLAQGINGSGIKIGIVGRSDILLDDVETYRSISGLPANDPVFIHAGQDAGVLPGDDSESDLDVEISGGVAPNATVDFVIGTPTFLVDGITNSYEYLIENNLTDIISSSYGDCESNEGAGGNLFNAQLFEQGAAQGISIFIAEGDNGPAGCDAQGSQTYEVLGYASGAEEATWYSVGVGGTEFYGDSGSSYSTYWNPSNASNLESAIKYIPEYPWNEAGVASPSPDSSSDLEDLWSGSGAVSAYYLRPPWQTGSGINNSSDPTLTLANGATGNWVASVNITNAGSGYTTAPTVTFGSGCSDAPAATSVLGSGATAGQVVGLEFTGYTSHYQGFNCTSVPSVTFSAPSSGTTATGTAVLGPMQNILPLISGVPHRLTPDLSLNAAVGHDGTIYCDEGICDEGYLDLVGGTSVAAPSMAGVQALIDQANGGRQGMPAYIYYQLANAQNDANCNSSNNPLNSSNCAFQDVTLGNTFICGQGSYSGRSAVCSATATSAKIGFAAGTGFDLATGLGSPNVANLATQWSSVTFNSSNATLNLSQTSFQHGTSITLSGSVAAGSGTGTPTGDVAFIVSQGAIGDTNNEVTGAMNGPVAFATLSGGSYSATLNNLPGGTYYVTARYGGDDNFASSLSAGIQVTVSSESGGVTITPYALNALETGANPCTITAQNTFTYGQDTLINVNVAGASGDGAPTGTVALTLDGNPLQTLTLDPNGNAYAFSGAITNPLANASNCIYEYLYPSTTLAGGSHTIGATYSGDNSVQAATATPASITVSQISPGTMTLSVAGSTSTSTPAVVTSGATVPLAVSWPTSTSSPLVTYEPMPGASGPTGTVTFTDTTTNTVLGTATLHPYLVYENEGTSSSAVPLYLYTATGQTSTTGITANGSHSITASYSGDSNYSSATATGSVTVGGTTATTVAVTSSANPTTLGGVPTLTATVTTATAGTVTFFDGTTVLGQGSTVGTAHTSTLKISSTYPFVGGAHSITAAYSGTGTTSQASVSPVFTENVTQGTMAITLSSKTTDNSGNTFSLTAILNCATGGCGTNPFLGTATDFSNVYPPVLNNVNFYDGATLLGSVQATQITYEQGGSSIWSAQFSTTLSATGSHSITAQYSDANYASATSNALAITVTSSQSLSFTSAPPPSAVYGSSFAVAASATSGLTPTYTSFGSCSNSGATYTMIKGTGSCLVIVSQAGNTTYGAAAQIQQAVSATLAANTVTLSSVPASAEYGSTFTISAAGLGTGAITYTSDGVVCTNSGASYTVIGTGTCVVSASQAADTNYQSASASQNVSAIDAQTSVGVQSSGPSAYGASVTFTATITTDTNSVKGRNARKGNVKSQVLSGTVSWSGNTGCASSPLSGNPPQTATCTTSSLAVGSDTVTASYAGDPNHSNASGNTSQTVSEAASSISVTNVSPAAEDYAANTPVTITAVLSWSGSGAAPNANNIAISGNGPGSYGATSCGSAIGDTITCSATYTPNNDPAGTYTESATFTSDGNYSASSSPQTGNFAINGATTMTGVSSNSNPSTYGVSVTFTATITAENNFVKGRDSRKGRVKSNDITGTVSWSGNTGCSTSNVTWSGANSNATATCTTNSLGVGSATVTATYSGDANHSGSNGQVIQTVNGGASTSINVTSVSPTNEDYAANTPITITAVLSWFGSGTAPNANNITIGGNGPGTYGSTSCGAPSGDTITCSATYTPNNDPAGMYTESATFTSDGNYGGSSSSQTNNFTINQATSSVSVGSSASGAITYGTSVTFTATISGENSFVKGRAGRNGKVKSNDITGTVAWSANTGCGTTNVTGPYPGVATCTTSSLNAGSDTVTATYSGDANHSGSNGSVSQTVNQAAATVTLSNLTQTYTGAGLSPTVTTVPAGLSTTPTGYPDTNVGSYSVTATVSDPNYTGSAHGTFTINQASQTITLSNVPSSAAYNSQFTVTGTASSGLAVAFTSSGGCSNNGATYTMTSGTTTCFVIANQAGNSNYTVAPQATKTVTASKINPSVTFTGLATTLPYNTTYTLAATTNASTTASITDATPSVCALSGSTVTIVKTSGNCEVTATWTADQNYNSAALSQTGTAEKGIATITWSTPAAISYGTALTGTQLDASATPSAIYPTGVYMPASGKVEDAGTQTLKVTFTPTDTVHYKAGTATVSLVVNQDSTMTSITSSDQTLTLNHGSVTGTVDVAVTSYKPTGKVTLTTSPSGPTCMATLTAATGDGDCKLKFTAAGVYTITATYPGDANHTGSNNSTQTSTITVNP